MRIPVSTIWFICKTIIGITFTYRLLRMVKSSYPKAQTKTETYQFETTTYTQKYKEISRTCQPKNNIVFIKVPKAAGSTVTNILQRYGDKNNLKFVLPASDTDFTLGGYPQPFETPEEYIGKQVNIIANHASFNKKTMRELMPLDTVYIGILRDPMSHLKSHVKFFKVDPRLAEFERDPWHYELNGKFMRYIGVQSKLFGFDKSFLELTYGFNDFLMKTDNRFKIIIIANYFKESMIVLKNLLCWTFDDILYLPQKVASNPNDVILGDQKSEVWDNVEHYSNYTLAEQNYKQWNPADFAMFEYFNKSLWKKINKMGDLFHLELARYEKMLVQVQEDCEIALYNRSKLQDLLNMPTEDQRTDNCRKMLLPPSKYIEQILRPKQKDLSK